MSVSGFSVAHDAEVLQYRRMRAAFVAEEKMRKEGEKQRQQELLGQCSTAEKGGSKSRGMGGVVLRRVFGLKRRAGKGNDQGSNGGREVGRERGKVAGKREEEDEGWSDAETEVDMIDILRDGEKGAEVERLRPGRREKAPPYVFMQAMAGLTAPLGRRG